jgi:GTP cyclohydrolase FolE2
LRYPLPFADRDGVAHRRSRPHVYVALAEDRKGTHMSRLVALLEERAAPGPRRSPWRAARAGGTC